MSDAMEDTIIPDGAWEFNEEVTLVFGDMLQRSIPDYEIMRQAVNGLAFKSLEGYRDTAVLDAGCSNGLALESLDNYCKERNHTLSNLSGLDVSGPMLGDALNRSDWRWDLRAHDLREHLPYNNDQFDVVFCVLTLQFTPMAHRQRIVDELTRVTRWGGRLVLVEKIRGATSELDDDMISVYYDHKRNMGYTEEQIERKRLSLDGVLEPLTAMENERLLLNAGYYQTDCFWRWMNFAGWVGVKTWEGGAKQQFRDRPA